MVSLREELSESVRKLSTGQIVSGVSSLDTLLARHNVGVFERSPDYTEQTRRLYRLSVPSSTDIDRLLQELAKDSSVEYAGRIEMLKTALTPQDPDWAQQWNFDSSHLQAEDAWNIATGTSNVILAIIDTGLDHTHPDLAQNIWRGINPIGRDFCGNMIARCNYGMGMTNPDNDPQHVGGDNHSHGTKMAGVSAANINNGSNRSKQCLGDGADRAGGSGSRNEQWNYDLSSRLSECGRRHGCGPERR